MRTGWDEAWLAVHLAKQGAPVAPKPVSRVSAPAICRDARPPVSTFAITLPLRLPNMANQRLHPLERARLVKRQRNAVRNNIGPGMLPPLPATITMTRVGPRALDSDGAVISAKACRDAIAELYGVDDGSSLYTWKVAQEKSGRGVYAVRIEIVADGVTE